jgi:hypothetical protein
MTWFHFTDPVANMTLILYTNDMEIGIVLNVFFARQNTKPSANHLFTNAEAETTNEWLRLFAFAWN